MYNILVCDDEKDIVRAIEIYLKAQNYQVFPCYNGHQALDILHTESIDLALLDIMMPQMDGIELTKRIRRFSSIPIIILSAKGELEDRVLGLEVGADDYITKPFDSTELLARVKSCLRRIEMSQDIKDESGIYRVGRIYIDDNKKQVQVDGEVVKLTPYEYGILLLLMQNQGKVYNSDQIYEHVWQQPAYNVKKIISVHMSRLRDKIEINPSSPDQIKSVYGMGYKIEDK